MRNIFADTVVFLVTGSMYVNDKRTAARPIRATNKEGPRVDAKPSSVCRAESLRTALTKARKTNPIVVSVDSGKAVGLLEDPGGFAMTKQTPTHPIQFILFVDLCVRSSIERKKPDKWNGKATDCAEH